MYESERGGAGLLPLQTGAVVAYAHQAMSTRIHDSEWNLFLEHLKRVPVYFTAAREVGLKPSAVKARRERDPDFRRDWDEALEEAKGGVEAELHRRAVTGVDKPITYKGEITGYYREYSDSLLMFYMKKLDPSYRDRQQVEVNATMASKSMTDQERAEMIASILAGVQARLQEDDDVDPCS